VSILPPPSGDWESRLSPFPWGDLVDDERSPVAGGCIQLDDNGFLAGRGIVLRSCWNFGFGDSNEAFAEE
jgi:hypothetical protein